MGTVVPRLRLKACCAWPVIPLQNYIYRLLSAWSCCQWITCAGAYCNNSGAPCKLLHCRCASNTGELRHFLFVVFFFKANGFKWLLKIIVIYVTCIFRAMPREETLITSLLRELSSFRCLTTAKIHCLMWTDKANVSYSWLSLLLTVCIVRPRKLTTVFLSPRGRCYSGLLVRCCLQKHLITATQSQVHTSS